MKPKISKLTECPQEMPVTPEMKAYAQKIGYVADLYSLTEDFLIHHGAEGTLFKNWGLAWKKWLRNQKEWYPNKNVSSNRQPGTHKPAPIPQEDRKIVTKEEFAALKRKINKGM